MLSRTVSVVLLLALGFIVSACGGQPSATSAVNPSPSAFQPSQEEMARRAVAYVQQQIGMRGGEPEVELARPTSPTEIAQMQLPINASPVVLPSGTPAWCDRHMPVPAPYWSCEPNAPLFIVILHGNFDRDIGTGVPGANGETTWITKPVTYVALTYDLRHDDQPVSTATSCSGAIFKRWLNDSALPDMEPHDHGPACT